MLLAAAAAIAGIAIAAIGGGGSKPRPHAGPAGSVVQIAAGYAGVPAAEVRRRMRQGESLGQIAAASKGGSRRGLIEALYAKKAAAVRARGLSPAAERSELQALRLSLLAQVDRTRRRPGLIRGAAAYLGMSEAELAARLAGGRTLAQVAAATPGRSSAGLVDALVAARRRTIEQARRDRQISAATAHRAIARLAGRARRQVEQPGG